MPFPLGVQTVTLTSGAVGYRAPDGSHAVGTIRFTPSVSRVTSAEHGVIALGTNNATLNASGGFTATLLANDADGFTPSGWTYRVDEEFTNAPGRAYNISLPASAATVALPSIAPTVESTGTYVVVTGPAGPTGATGAQGSAGATGPQGPAGANGSNAQAEAYTDAAVASHAADSTSVHGITDTAALETSTGAQAKVTAHSGATDPHGDRAAASAALSAHASDTTDVHGITDTAALETAAGATSKVSVHAAAVDPHGDRSWADSKFATTTALGTLNTTVTALSGSVVSLDGFVNDCLARVAAIEQGTAFLSGVNSSDDVNVNGGNLTVTDFAKGYRFRVDGSSLDLEATGTDLIVSNWSGSGFNGTQRSYLRLSADAQNIQIAGKVEFADSLYGTVRHTLDGAANTLGFHGATPVTRQAVTGSRGGNAALASLLTALDTLGIIDDQTTA
ncbi:collagen-like protein [Streptomyces sp. NPDC060064]|uniref:collagen-like protein n=1 Tax=Streptomyces sp. NPDC060064 TaxID=3347049 RepID=UPI00368EB17E